jgi:hypothetical protein
MPTEPPPAVPWPPTGRFEGLGDFQSTLRAVLMTAAARHARQMWWLSPSFEGWPLESTELLDSLSAWARTGTVRLHWIASDFGGLRRHMPRLVRWRQQWGHVVSCQRPDDELAASMRPSGVLVDDDLALLLHDERHWRGRVSAEARDVQACRERIDAILQRSAATFPVTTLGL